MLSDQAAEAPGRNNAFNYVPGPRIQRARFNLSHERKVTVDFGQLIPVLCMEMVPGDSFTLSQNLVARLQAMLAPVLHGADVWLDTFFVATRNLWPTVDTSGNNWETYIAGGVDGLNAAVVPRWNVGAANHDVGSLWDFFGLPTWSTANTFTAQFPDAIVPLAFPLWAYNNIWNEWYRDQTLQTAVALTQETILGRAWPADFFTKALPFQQRGTAPALPISGSAPLSWPAAAFDTTSPSGVSSSFSFTASDPVMHLASGGVNAPANAKAMLERGTASLASATTFTVNDIRLAALIQRQLEVRARGGVRYTEFLQAVYGTHPRDDRLNRPEFIGRVRVPLIMSEVLQTSASNTQPTPQGNLAGHGIGVGQGYVGKYFAPEFGYLMTLLSVMPDPAYQQGTDRMWLRTSRYDWPIPEFAGMSEQAVINQELYLNNDSLNQTIFGYQARFNELRYQRNSVHGLFRTTLNYWHWGRIFATRPGLNASFISIGSTELASLKRTFAVTSQPSFLITVGSRVDAVRPFPEFGVPGLSRI